MLKSKISIIDVGNIQHQPQRFVGGGDSSWLISPGWLPKISPNKSVLFVAPPLLPLSCMEKHLIWGFCRVHILSFSMHPLTSSCYFLHEILAYCELERPFRSFLTAITWKIQQLCYMGAQFMSDESVNVAPCSGWAKETACPCGEGRGTLTAPSPPGLPSKHVILPLLCASPAHLFTRGPC